MKYIILALLIISTPAMAQDMSPYEQSQVDTAAGAPVSQPDAQGIAGSQAQDNPPDYAVGTPTGN